MMATTMLKPKRVTIVKNERSKIALLATVAKLGTVPFTLSGNSLKNKSTHNGNIHDYYCRKNMLIEWVISKVNKINGVILI